MRGHLFHILLKGKKSIFWQQKLKSRSLWASRIDSVLRLIYMKLHENVSQDGQVRGNSGSCNCRTALALLKTSSHLLCPLPTPSSPLLINRGKRI